MVSGGAGLRTRDVVVTHGPGAQPACEVVASSRGGFGDAV